MFLRQNSIRKKNHYRIAKELNRPINTVLNEIRRGTFDQIEQNQRVQIYLADAGQANYVKNRNHSKPSFKLFQCKDFTFMDLPLALKRSSKNSKVRKHKKHLGKSIEERPAHIETREEFGHWEIDTVIGKKTKDDHVLLTLVERQTRNSLFVKIPDKTSEAVSRGLSELHEFFGSKFDQVFKTITSDNGLEFSELHKLEVKSETLVYFAHPYASHERGTNEP